MTDHVWFAQVGDVRNCCLKTLAPLHETQDLSLKLELFTNRFKVSWDVGAWGGIVTVFSVSDYMRV